MNRLGLVELIDNNFARFSHDKVIEAILQKATLSQKQHCHALIAATFENDISNIKK